MIARAIAAAAAAACAAALPAAAQLAQPQQGVAFEQRVGHGLPLALELRDEAGRPIALSRALGSVPAVLVLGYLHCRDLCSIVLTDAVRALDASGLAAGRDYRALFVSIDPADDAPALAAARRDRVPEADRAAWRFLGRDAPAIGRLANAIGFRYRADPAGGAFAHPAGFVVLTPQGTIARYFNGVKFAPRDLRLALVQAGAGKIGAISDRIALLCYHFDPSKGRYTITVMRVLDGVIALFLAGCAIFAVLVLRGRGREAR